MEGLSVSVITHHFTKDDWQSHSIVQISVYTNADYMILPGAYDLDEDHKTYTWKCQCGAQETLTLPAALAAQSFNFHKPLPFTNGGHGPRPDQWFFSNLCTFQKASGHYADPPEDPEETSDLPNPKSVGLGSELIEKIINERIEARRQLGSLDPVSDGAKDAADAILDLFPTRGPGKAKHTRHSRRPS